MNTQGIELNNSAAGAIDANTCSADSSSSPTRSKPAKLGFSNMLDYMRHDPRGNPRLDFSGLKRDQAAALQEVTVEEFVVHEGEDFRDVRRVKFKLVDKRSALSDLGRHLGIFNDKLQR